MTFQAAMDALEADAGVWTTVSETLTTASGSASALSLSGRELSKTATQEGLVDTYRQIQALVAMLCTEGGTEAQNISRTLRNVHRQYDLDDETARRTLEGVWDAPR